MEDKNVHTSVSGGAPSSSRWNPTKEQISILEGLYRQGIRTPSAEQIQQITSRLRAYGHIEGKNVFYWFQNHKARQRQKQKQQESMGYVNRFFHNTAPPVLVPCHPPCNNVFCSPFYTPNSGVGFYPHYPEVLLPGGVRSRPSTDKQAEKMKGSGVGAAYVPLQPQYYSMQYAGDVNYETINTTSGHQALHLFPLQPTEILEGRSATASAEESNPSSSSQTTGFEDGSEERPFFNFFAEHGSCGSE